MKKMNRVIITAVHSLSVL